MAKPSGHILDKIKPLSDIIETDLENQINNLPISGEGYEGKRIQYLVDEELELYDEIRTLQIKGNWYKDSKDERRMNECIKILMQKSKQLTEVSKKYMEETGFTASPIQRRLSGKETILERTPDGDIHWTNYIDDTERVKMPEGFVDSYKIADEEYRQRLKDGTKEVRQQKTIEEEEEENNAYADKLEKDLYKQINHLLEMNPERYEKLLKLGKWYNELLIMRRIGNTVCYIKHEEVDLQEELMKVKKEFADAMQGGGIKRVEVSVYLYSCEAGSCSEKAEYVGNIDGRLKKLCKEHRNLGIIFSYQCDGGKEYVLNVKYLYLNKDGNPTCKEHR